MKKILVLISTIVPLFACADGRDWAIEITYHTSDGQHTGFLSSQYWVKDCEERFLPFDTTLIEAEGVPARTAFEHEFFSRYGAQEAIYIYDRIIDRFAYSRNSKLPIPPWSFDETSGHAVELAAMHSIRLVRVLVKTDYFMDVHSPLEPADTTWIGGASKVYYPVGQEVGCRLEIYSFSDQPVEALIDEYGALYLRREKLSPFELKRYNSVLLQLKAARVIVIELCGC